jgi:hypothetical protein
LVHERDAVFGHEPDHILSKRHGGDTTPQNLAWACFDCNRLKGCDLSSIDLETGRIVRLFNPRRDDWHQHFRLRQGRIIPLTAIGRATEFLLQLNRKDAVDSRLRPTT